MSVTYFAPFKQWKVHRELEVGDFVRTQGRFFIIDEIRRFRRSYSYTAAASADLVELTGSMVKRFQHIDKMAVQPGSGMTMTVALTYRGVDTTGMQYAHTWNQNNANVDAPTVLDINSFSREDIFHITVTLSGQTASLVWFSGEEYTLVEYPNSSAGWYISDPVRAADYVGKPPRFVIVHPYGFSRTVSIQEFEGGDMAGRLRV